MKKKKNSLKIFLISHLYRCISYSILKISLKLKISSSKSDEHGKMIWRRLNIIYS